MKPVIQVINRHNMSTLQKLTVCFIRQDRNFAKSNYWLCHVCPFLRPSICLVVWLTQDNTKQCTCPPLLFCDFRGTVQSPPSLQLHKGSTNLSKSRLFPREYTGEWVGWIIQAVVLVGQQSKCQIFQAGLHHLQKYKKHLYFSQVI